MYGCNQVIKFTESQFMRLKRAAVGFASTFNNTLLCASHIGYFRNNPVLHEYISVDNSYPSNLKRARITQYWHNPKASAIIFLTMYSSGKPPRVFFLFFHRKNLVWAFQRTEHHPVQWDESRLQGFYTAASAFPSRTHSSSKARKLSWHVTCTRTRRSSIQVIR